MIYLCIGKIDSLWINPFRTRLNVNGRVYEIVKGGEKHYLVTLSGVKYELRNFSIDNNVLVILVNEDLSDYFNMCEGVDGLK